MASRCVPCDVTFTSSNDLQQHKVDSPAHQHDCRACDRHFGSSTAMEQHLRDSPVHAASFDCDACDRSFDTQRALEQHMNDAPAHLQESHASSFDCQTCNRSFGSQSALEHHLRDSPVHGARFDCHTCNRSFGSESALEQHLQDSPLHENDSGTPLDLFFRSFASFDYDHTLPPATSYRHLERHKGWQRGDTASRAAWARYQDALEEELRMWFGAEDDLTAWHALCRAIGIDPLPQRCDLCQAVVRRTHVNIVDLIEWGRNRRGGENGSVMTFDDEEELRDYTIRTGKVFRNTLGGEGRNVVLRHLLRKVFRGRSWTVRL